MGQDDKEKVALAMQLLSRREYAESEQIFKNLITSGSELAESFYGMGMIRLASGQLENATKQFENCVKLQPNHANAYYYLGQIAEQRHDAEGTKRHYDKVLEINPKHAGALKKVAPARELGVMKAVVSSTQSDLYALLRRSAEPVEHEISGHLDAIAALIGTRSERYRAFINLPKLFVIIFTAGVSLACLATPFVVGLPKQQYYGLRLIAVTMFLVTFIGTVTGYLQAKNSKIRCERDWLIRSKGVLSKSEENMHLFILSRGQVSVHQTLINRMTGDGTLELTGLSLCGYFRRPELNALSVHFRQLSLLNPTSRQVLAALGELKNIRSGAQ